MATRSGPAIPVRRSRAGAYLTGMSRREKVTWLRWAILLGLVLAWELYARLAGDVNLIAAPSQAVTAFFTRLMTDGRIRYAIGLTLYEVTSAYLLSILFGLALGLAIGWTSFGRRGLYPIVLFLYAIPQIVLLPLFVLIFGIGPGCKIAFGFSHGIFPIIVNTVAGMSSVSMLHIKGAQSMGASRLHIARHVYLPHIATSLFAGLRLAMTLTLLGVILAELYVSTTGIGLFTKMFAESLNPAPLFALVGTLAAIAVGLNETVRILERRMTRWMR